MNNFVKILTVTALMTILFGVYTLPARAAEDGKTINESSTVNTTVITDERLKIDGTLNGDVICMNERTEITGTVNNDILCASGVIVINGQVNGDVRLVAEKVVIRGAVAGSATILASTLIVEEGASIGGDLSGITQSTTLRGGVGRDVLVSAETMKITGMAGRDVNVSVKNLSVTANATINGWIRHYGADSVSIDDTATVGTVKAYNAMPSDAASASPLAIVASVLLAVGLSTLALAALIPRVLQRVAEEGNESLLLTLLTGVVCVIFIPLLLVLLLFTGAGTPLAIAGGIAWLLLLALSIPAAIQTVGDKITGEQTTHIIIKTVIGAGVVLAAIVIPILNIIAMPLIIILGSGAIVRALIKSIGKPNYRTKSHPQVSPDA